MRTIFYSGSATIALLVLVSPTQTPTAVGGFTNLSTEPQPATSAVVAPPAQLTPAALPKTEREIPAAPTSTTLLATPAATTSPPASVSPTPTIEPEPTTEPEPVPPAQSVTAATAPPTSRAPSRTPTIVAALEPEPAAEPSSAALSKYDAAVQALLLATNSTRAAAGRPALALHQTLTRTAQQKADDMVARDYFAHTSPTGCDQTCLLDQTGLSLQTWGENLMFYPYLTKPDAEVMADTVIDGWDESHNHRENQLSRDYTYIGFGIAEADDTYYVVAHYGAPFTD